MSGRNDEMRRALENVLNKAGQEWQNGHRISDARFTHRTVAAACHHEHDSFADRLGALVLRPAPLMAAAAVVVLAGVSAAGLLLGTSHGSLAVSSGDVSVTGVAGHFNLINNSSRITTGPNSSAIMELDRGRVQVFLSSATQMDILENDEVTLPNGSVWVSVQKDSGHFGLQTPSGRIDVTGTSFGVRETADGFRVYLAHGSIDLTVNGETVTLAPDEYAVLNSEGSFSGVMSAAGTEPPTWAEGLYREYQITHTANYYPSSSLLR